MASLVGDLVAQLCQSEDYLYPMWGCNRKKKKERDEILNISFLFMHYVV